MGFNCESCIVRTKICNPKYINKVTVWNGKLKTENNTQAFTIQTMKGSKLYNPSLYSPYKLTNHINNTQKLQIKTRPKNSIVGCTFIDEKKRIPAKCRDAQTTLKFLVINEKLLWLIFTNNSYYLAQNLISNQRFSFSIHTKEKHSTEANKLDSKTMCSWNEY